MNRNYLIGLISGIILLIAAIFFVLRRHQPPIDSVYHAIPLDAAVIVDVKSFPEFSDEIIKDNKIWGELATLKLFDPLRKQLILLDSLGKRYEGMKTLMTKGHEIMLSGHPSGKNQIAFIYYIRLNDAGEFRDFDRMMQEFQGAVVTSRKYENVEVKDVLVQDSRDGFSYAYTGGLLILSESSILLENSIRQLSASETILTKKGLNELIRTAGKNTNINLFLNYAYIPRIAAGIFHNRYASELKFAGRFGSWIELDVNVKPDLLILNGFSAGSDGDNHFLSVFRHQKPLKPEIFGNIPIPVNTFGVLGISNLKQYLVDYRSYLREEGTLPEYERRLDELKKNYQIDLETDFDSIFENEACFASSDQLGDTTMNQFFSLIRVKSIDDAGQVFDRWAGAYARSQKIPKSQFISDLKLDNDISIRIYEFPFANIPASIFGDVFTGGSNRYCTTSGNYIIFGNSPLAIKNYVHHILLHSTLGTDLEFNNFSEYFSNQYNFFFYHKPVLSGGLYSNFLRKDVSDDLLKKMDHIAKLQALVYQFNINGHGFIYNNIFIKYTPRNTDVSPKTVWESALSGNILFKPVMVTNHTNNDNEIFVQDDKFNIYLINKVGRILWKINIGEPILSDVYQIDFYRNRKLQYLFNTKSKLFLIDRNGNPTEKFPVALRSPATNGIAVLDYDHNRNYRIFVAGADHKIYALDKEGRTIQGWEFDKTEGTVTHPVQYFVFNKLDYLVFSDDYRVYIVNRRGQQRIKPDRNFPVSVNNTVQALGIRDHRDFRFAITDTSGLIHLIDLKGKTSTFKVGKFPAGHYFNVVDINKDGLRDYVFTYGSSLKVFGVSGKSVLDLEPGFTIAYPPVFYEFSANHYQIGLVDKENEKIYLYDGSGNLHDGFPLKGSTQFSIGLLNNSENRFNLIVGSKLNFLYNYSVQ